MNYRRLAVLLSVIGKRSTGISVLASLIITVKLIYILDEFAIKEVKRNVLRTYS